MSRRKAVQFSRAGLNAGDGGGGGADEGSGGKVSKDSVKKSSLKESFVAFFPRLVDALFVSAPSLYLSPVLLDPRAVSASALSLQFLLLPESLSAAMTYHLFGASRLLLGTLYPAYASYKAVRTKNVREYVKWMMYWIVFAFFTAFEVVADIFVAFWFPFYYELKIIFLIWLISPVSRGSLGSSLLYRKLVHPNLMKREDEIDRWMGRVQEQGYNGAVRLGSRAFQYVTNLVMQTAIKAPAIMAEMANMANNVDAAAANMIDVTDGGDIVEDRRLVEHVGPPLGNAASPPSEPMECESVAAVELTREIEEVIESPVREDMMMMATTSNSSANAEGTDMDDKRKSKRVGRPRKNLYSAPCNPVAFSSDDEDDTDASNRATAAQSSYGSARDSEDEEVMGTANSGSSGPDHDPDFDPEVTVADPAAATRRRTRAGATTRTRAGSKTKNKKKN